MKTKSFTATERMVCTVARLLKGRTSVFIGTGVPMLAAALARRLYAPELLPVFEFGAMGSPLDELPLGVGESRTFRRAIAAGGICDVMEAAQRGVIQDGVLGAAQIDPYGNINTTAIGDYDRPAVRLPGAGGANDVGSLCWRTFIILKQDRRRFVEKVDFITTPGYLDGPGSRERAGLPAHTGPHRVVTDMAVYDFEPRTKRLRLIALNPGCSLDDVRRESSFPIIPASTIAINDDPTGAELETLRRDIDPENTFL